MLVYTLNNNKIAPLFTSLYTNELPKRVSVRFLQQLGFKSSRERDLIRFLHAFGFIDAKSVPTSTYSAFKNSPSVDAFVSERAKEVYSFVTSLLLESAELETCFVKNFPNESLENIKLGVKTFLTINTQYKVFTSSEKSTLNVTGVSSTFQKKTPINININLPETENPSVYEAIFKHLKGLIRD